jgi:hypothetical protein
MTNVTFRRCAALYVSRLMVVVPPTETPEVGISHLATAEGAGEE